MCSSSTYDNITDFEWYLSVLVDLTYISNVDVGAEIRDQLIDIVGRVRAARAYTVKLMAKLLCDKTLVERAKEPGSCSEVLWAAAWICGEYCRYASPTALWNLAFIVNLPCTASSQHLRSCFPTSWTQILSTWIAILPLCTFKRQSRSLATGR